MREITFLRFLSVLAPTVISTKQNIVIFTQISGLLYKLLSIDAKGSYRIDLLVIKKLCKEPLNNNAISKLFSEYNIFEIKGIHSTLTPDAYYKTHGYAGLFINSHGKTNQLSRSLVTLSFISRKFPRKLTKHLTKDCKLPIEKTAPGVYYINKEMYRTQLIVTGELNQLTHANNTIKELRATIADKDAIIANLSAQLNTQI